MDYCNEHKIPEFQTELYWSFSESEEIQSVIGKKQKSRMAAKRSGTVSSFLITIQLLICLYEAVNGDDVTVCFLVCLEAIKRLHQFAKLNDNLSPNTRNASLTVHGEVRNSPFCTYRHQLSIPQLLQKTWEKNEDPTSNMIVWIHTILFKESTSQSTPLNDVQKTFALLAPTQLTVLEEIPSFNLWKKGIQYLIEFKYQPIKLLISENELNKIKDFHLLLFAFILNQTPPPSEFISTSKNFLIVPTIINTTQQPPQITIDWKRTLFSWSFITEKT
jgi:hypothetical protein